jgi:amidophosphoribosyltransferase
LSLEGVYRAVGLAPEGFCTACFSGEYPVPVQFELERANPKLRLETPFGLAVDLPSPVEFPDRAAPPPEPAHSR